MAISIFQTYIRQFQKQHIVLNNIILQCKKCI